MPKHDSKKNIPSEIEGQVRVEDFVEIPKADSREMVDHPSHYNAGKYEVIDVIEDWNLGFNLGNAVKYIARCEHKWSKVEDLQKASWYLEREIERELKKRAEEATRQ